MNENQGQASKRIKAQVKAELEKAYMALNMASKDYDLIDTIENDKIIKARKQVLDLLNTLDL